MNNNGGAENLHPMENFRNYSNVNVPPSDFAVGGDPRSTFFKPPQYRPQQAANMAKGALPMPFRPDNAQLHSTLVPAPKQIPARAGEKRKFLNVLLRFVHVIMFIYYK